MKNRIATPFFLLQIVLLKVCGAQPLPQPEHVIVVMLENRGYSTIVDSSYAPFIKSIIQGPNAALFAASYAITHPSQPNYLALFSGSTQGCNSNSLPSNLPFNTCNLGTSLINTGYSFAGFSEDLPEEGSLVASSGFYVQRHCLWTFWIGAETYSIPAASHKMYSSFPDSLNYATLPTLSFVIPNLNNDMHNPASPGSVAVSNGDLWLRNNLGPLYRWALNTNNLLILHYDEDEGTIVNGQLTLPNHIPTIFAGGMVEKGIYYDKINHYNVLRTLEELYQLPYCDSSANYTPILNCWKQNTNSINQPLSKNKLKIVKSEEGIYCSVLLNSEFPFNIKLTNYDGRLIASGSGTVFIKTENLTPGVYFVIADNGKDILKQKMIWK